MGISVYAWSTWKLPLALSIDLESFDYHVHTCPAVMQLVAMETNACDIQHKGLM